MKFNTKVIHAGQKPEETSGAVMPPVFFTSTFAQEKPNVNKGYDYARVGNPTRTALEKLIAGIEYSDEAVCFSSGVAATDAVMKTLRPGDHVISTNDLYGGSYRLFQTVYEDVGRKPPSCGLTELAEGQKGTRSVTKLVCAETPANLLLSILDSEAVSHIAHQRNALCSVDNTFDAPYPQHPLKLGAHAAM